MTDEERIAKLEHAIVGLAAQNEALSSQVLNLGNAVFGLENRIAEVEQRPMKYEFSAPTYVVDDEGGGADASYHSAVSLEIARSIDCVEDWIEGGPS